MARPPKSIADIKPAGYNPRVITSTELTKLKRSIESLGDLSGIVVNVAGKAPITVSGHQRLKTLKGKKTKLVRAPCKQDAVGTVATGHIEVRDGSSIIKIPYREVNWPDKTMEMVANINANAAGGDFDQAKLGAVMSKLEGSKTFGVEALALDGFDIQKAMIQHRRTSKHQQSDDTPTKGTLSKGSDDEEFERVDPRGTKFAHVCPRCKFAFD